jgi:endonuclease I
MPLNSIRALGALSLLFAFASAHAQVGSGAVAFNGGATQDFNTLASSGTGSTLPVGWYFREASGTTQTTYQADDGTLNQANVMSYGSGGSTDRGFGVLPGNALGGSGSVVADIGARLTNGSGTTISSLQIAFVTELWLYQGAAGERFAFEYSTDASSLTSGTWTPFVALDAVTPAASGNGKKDGNLAANRTAVSGTITGLNLAAGSDLWVRWRATNLAGNDNGLAIDDVVFGTPVDNPPALASSIPPHNPPQPVPVTSNITLTFTETVNVTGSWFSFSCGSGTPGLSATPGPATTFTLTPAGPLPFGRVCTLFINASLVTDIDGSTQDAMATNETIQFETEADDPPMLDATTPTDNATNVARAANLSVTFNEPVTAPLAAFGIFCPDNAPTSLAFTLNSDDERTFTLDPIADLPGNTACRLFADKNQIADKDGTFNNLADDVRVNFTTAMVAPPSVVSTVPAKNATNFPAVGDLQVEFDQTVTLAPGAFTLTCAQSSGISLLPNASSGSSFTIDTGTTLDAGDTCTFTVVATQVTNDAAQTMSANEVVSFSVASNSSGNYYQNVNLSSPAQLRCSLHQTIKGHAVFDYQWTVLEIADAAPPDVCAAGQNSPNQYILDVYRNRCYAKPGQRSGATGPGFYNREHTWPKSLGFGGDPSASKPPSTDFHMLHLSASDYNSTRSNYPYGNCVSGCGNEPTDVNNGTGGSSYGKSNHLGSNADGDTVYEVWDDMKGNMARAVMYMAIRYEGDPHPNGTPEPNLELTNNLALVSGSNPYMGKLDTLLQWHAFDPVIDREHERNEVVYTYQNNRNPFVDHPEWATLALFQSTSPAQCVLNTNAPAANDDTYATPINTVINTALTAANDGVLSNDSDVEGAPLSAELVSSVASGTLALAANGDFTYTPPNGFCGSTSFSYRASDGVRPSATRTASITVGGSCSSNNPPVANADVLTVVEDDAATIVNVIANDTSAPDVGETLSVVAVTQGSIGNVTLVSGVVRYAPSANANGSDSFTYTISDGNGGTATATVSVTVSPANDAPQASGTLAPRTAQEGVAITVFSVAAGFSDVDVGDDLDFSQTGLPAGLVLDAETGQISGTPSAGSAIPSVTVTITATDTGGLTAQQSFLYEVTAAGDGLVIFDNGFEGNN